MGASHAFGTQRRDREGKFAPIGHHESSVNLEDSGFDVLNLDTYDPVDTTEINREVQQMVALARRSGQDVTQVGAWLREFDPTEKTG